MAVVRKEFPRAFISLHIICLLTAGHRPPLAVLPSRKRKIHQVVGEERDGGDEAASWGEVHRGLLGFIQRGEAATGTRVRCRG